MTDRRDRFDVQLRCGVVGRAPRSFDAPAVPTAALALRRALEAIAAEYPRYGYRRVTADLGRCGWAIHHKRVLQVLRAENLLVAVKRYCRTTDGTHHDGRDPNLRRGLDIVRPVQVWCADLTYVWRRDEGIELAVVLDVFTRRLRGWALG